MKYYLVKHALLEKPSKKCGDKKVSKDLQKNNERVYLDIATVNRNDGQGRLAKPHWRILVDERTQMKFSDHFFDKG